MSLSADVNYQTRSGTTRRHVYLSAASANTFFKGAMVCINSSGLLVEAADTANFKFAGVVVENTIVPAAGANVEVETGVVRIPWASAQQSDLGKLAYATADDTPALTVTNAPGPIGVIEDIEIGVAIWVNTDRRSL